MEQVSARLADQRIRNRVIECLEYLAEGDEGIRATGDVEYFESFFDWVEDERPWDWRDNSAYTPAEIEAVNGVLVALLAAVEETGDMDTEETVTSGWPRRIAPIAQTALNLLVQRGRFDEDREEAAPSRR